MKVKVEVEVDSEVERRTDQDGTIATSYLVQRFKNTMNRKDPRPGHSTALFEGRIIIGRPCSPTGPKDRDQGYFTALL